MTPEYSNILDGKTIFSVHVPKTAGTTLLHVLKRAIGPDAVFADYADDPCDPASPQHLDPERYFSNPINPPLGYKAVHGHFHIGKYSEHPQAFRLTFLRDPVDTILSIHTFWQTLGYGHNALHDYFLRNKLDVFETARLPLLRYMLSRNYFGNVDMRKFDFIGRYEIFSTEVEALSSKLGISLIADIHLNEVGNKRQTGYLKDDVKTRAILRDILIEDVRFYENAISLELR